jgi:DNA polymerase/3'-5' exonuclease PolX
MRPTIKGSNNKTIMKGTDKIVCKTEEEIFKFLNVEYKEPSER